MYIMDDIEKVLIEHESTNNDIFIKSDNIEMKLSLIDNSNNKLENFKETVKEVILCVVCLSKKIKNNNRIIHNGCINCTNGNENIHEKCLIKLKNNNFHINNCYVCNTVLPNQEVLDIAGQLVITDEILENTITETRTIVNNQNKLNILLVICINITEIIMYPVIFKFVLLIIYHIFFNNLAPNNFQFPPNYIDNNYIYTHFLIGIFITGSRCYLKPINMRFNIEQ